MDSGLRIHGLSTWYMAENNTAAFSSRPVSHYFLLGWEALLCSVSCSVDLWNLHQSVASSISRRAARRLGHLLSHLSIGASRILLLRGKSVRWPIETNALPQVGDLNIDGLSQQKPVSSCSFSVFVLSCLKASLTSSIQ